MTINPDNGTLTFTAPSLPNGPYDRLTRQWVYGAIDTDRKYANPSGCQRQDGVRWKWRS